MREGDRYPSAPSEGLPAGTCEGPGVGAVRATASSPATSPTPATSSAPSCSGLRTGFCARSGDGQVRAYNPSATASTPATASTSDRVSAWV